jgi:hypothetical protein
MEPRSAARRPPEWFRDDVARHEAARREVLRIDAARSIGENIEQADALIKAAFEFSRAFAARR